jgi:hypothetical protein
MCKHALQGVLAFRDFTIRDPRNFVICFQALILWIPRNFVILKQKKNLKKSEIFSEIFSGFYFICLFYPIFFIQKYLIYLVFLLHGSNEFSLYQRNVSMLVRLWYFDMATSSTYSQCSDIKYKLFAQFKRAE